jgi:hypothetical protein
MCLAAYSVDNWQLKWAGAWEGLVIEETLTCRSLSYHPRVMGFTLTSSSNENKCSANWFDKYSLPASFRCSPCLVNKILLLTISIILTWLKTLVNVFYW